MTEVPVYLAILFIACTLYTLILFWFAANKSGKVLVISIAWLALQGGLAYAQFYENQLTTPPTFPLVMVPTFVLMAVLFFTQKGRKFIDSLNLQTLYAIHVVRIPVEFGLYGLALYQAIPMLMTFEGVNFDIFAGITAPLILLGHFKRDWFSDSFVLIWNVLGAALLIGIIANAILSVESSLQTQAFDVPNKAILYFPYIWLACYIAPVVLFSHFVCIKRAYSK